MGVLKVFQHANILVFLLHGVRNEYRIPLCFSPERGFFSFMSAHPPEEIQK